MMRQVVILVMVAMLVVSCGRVVVPEGAEVRSVGLYPDYRDVVVPREIAPLNMMIVEDGVEGVCAVYEAGDRRMCVGSREGKYVIDEGEWRELLGDSAVGRVRVSVYYSMGEVCCRDTFSIGVSDDAFDKYVTYRLIEPGYEVWHALQIEERDMTSFRTRILADNSRLNGQCMNCHIHGGNGVSLFHLRGKGGATMLCRGGALRKVTLKNDSMVSGAVYGDIDRTGRYGVFSTNVIIPALHSVGSKRLEVYDTESDLCMADFETGRMILSDKVMGNETLETFPCFGADGRTVYYCSAGMRALPDSIGELKYSILRIGFDGEKWGDRVDTVWSAVRNGGSASFPKVSPDGKYLMFACSECGTFPIWHRETDLRMIDLETGEEVDVSELNSPVSETYHTWSSSGRWVVFASKRGDGQYGRVYVAHVDNEGRASRPFVIPQEDPESDILCLKSYNIPDVGYERAGFSSGDVERLFWGE